MSENLFPNIEHVHTRGPCEEEDRLTRVWCLYNQSAVNGDVSHPWYPPIVTCSEATPRRAGLSTSVSAH